MSLLRDQIIESIRDHGGAVERWTGQAVTRYHPWWIVHPSVATLIRDMTDDELERARAQLDAAVRRAPIAAFVVVWRAVVAECAVRYSPHSTTLDLTLDLER